MLHIRTTAAVLAATAALAVAGDAAASTPQSAIRCVEDAPCWTWSKMGNHKRGIVTAYGTPKIVGPSGYRRIWFDTPRSMRHLLGPKMKGDAWAIARAR